MAMTQDLLERQLATAKQRRENHEKLLSERGTAADSHHSCPTWRHFDAQCRQLATRLHRVAAKVASQSPQSSDEDGES